MEELLCQIRDSMDDLLAVYKLVHSKEIEQAKGAVLGQGNRRKIYDLCDGETGVSDIARRVGISQPAVSEHVAALAEAGLLARVRRNGRIFYTKRLER